MEGVDDEVEVFKMDFGCCVKLGVVPWPAAVAVLGTSAGTELDGEDAALGTTAAWRIDMIGLANFYKKNVFYYFL